MANQAMASKSGNNPEGKNGVPPKDYPADEILSTTLHRYAKEGVSLKDQLVRLQADHNLDIGRTRLTELRSQFQVPSTRKRAEHTVEEERVLDIIDNDVHNQKGYRYVHTMLRVKGTPVPRAAVRNTMLQYKPEGFDVRMPGSKQLKRVMLSSLGLFHSLGGDGHQKLNNQALRMGNIGLEIYAFKDQYCGLIPGKIVCLPSARKEAAIGHVYLDMVESVGAIPLTLTTDRGTETGWMHAMQSTLRSKLPLPSGIPTDKQYPPFVHLPSTRNTVIEALWRWLKEKAGLNIKSELLKGVTDGIFDPSNPIHEYVFYYVFPPIVQGVLDEFQEYWNHHRIRNQSGKLNPSGHVPLQVLACPRQYGGVDCRIRVSTDLLQEVRENLVASVGSREESCAFLSPEIKQTIKEEHERLGSPSLSFSNAWAYFTILVDAVSGRLIASPSTP